VRWIVNRAPAPLVVTAKIAMWVAIYFVGVAVALWLYFEGGILLLVGVAAGVAVLVALAWDRPRRKRLRAELAKTQQGPGTQALRSEAGPRHWTDRLPRPLRAVAQIAPFTLLAIGGFVLTLVLISFFGELRTDDPDTHVRLEEGSQGEVEPVFGGDYRIRVTILSIADGVDVGEEAPQPHPGNKYWAAEVSIENIGSRDVASPAWTLEDSHGHQHQRTFSGNSMTLLPTRAAVVPGEVISGWVVFQIPQTLHTRWLRVTPPDPLDHFEPNHLYFNAE